MTIKDLRQETDVLSIWQAINVTPMFDELTVWLNELSDELRDGVEKGTLHEEAFWYVYYLLKSYVYCTCMCIVYVTT